MYRIPKTATVCLTAFLVAALGVGCSTSSSSAIPAPAKGGEPAFVKGKVATEEDKEIAAERAKLSAEDRKLADAQEWCVISKDERLGAMGAPIKLMIEGKAVFVCCKGCVKAAEKDPAKTLATLAELQKKAAADKAIK